MHESGHSSTAITHHRSTVPREAAMYAPALIVDVTWWARARVEGNETNPPPDRQHIALRPVLRDHVLALYSMLRRHVDADDPSRSYGEIVVRPGVGIPVELGRPLDAIAEQIAAERDRGFPTLRAVVPFLDKLTFDEVLRPTRASLTVLQELVDESDGRVLLLPVTMYDGWDAYLTRAAPVRLSFDPQNRRVAECTSCVGTNLATWIMRAGGRTSPRVTIFVSHSKLDLAATDSAAVRLNQHIKENTETQIKTFFDTMEIQRGSSIAEQLVAGERDAVLLSLRTDHYADSAWCHEEVLTAKALQMPVVSVWSVREEERRALPYGGNMPTLLWDDKRLDQITHRCLMAWLHHLHFRLQAPTALALTDIKLQRAFISRPPELVDFALGGLPVDRDLVVLYPDPPMSAVEARLLRLAHPRVRLATPTTLFGGEVLSVDPAPPLAHRTIALSLSKPPGASPPGEGSNAAGFNALHVQDVVAHLTLCIVRAGARIAFGGHLLPGGFAPFLASIIAMHNSIGAGTAEIPLVYLASYLRHESSDIDVEHVGVDEQDIKVERVGVDDEDIVIDTATSGSLRVALALQQRAKRIQMAQTCDARIAIGGKDKHFYGRFPGRVEGCFRMLEAGKPIYPLGGFGGAAELVISALLGRMSDRLNDRRLRAEDPQFDAFCTLYDQDERRLTARGRTNPAREPATLDELAAYIAECGTVLRSGNPDAMWTNGLTVAENLRLFQSRDLMEIAHLVMKGLTTALPKSSVAGATAKGPLVRLFRGSIADVEATEVYAVPVVSGFAPAGSALALDERLGGRIRDRLQRPITDVEAIDTGGGRLAGRFIILVPLAYAGVVDLTVFQAPIESIKEACAKLARFVKANKVASLATVAFGVNIGLPANASVDALLAALRRESRSSALTVTICELVPERYEIIKRGLTGAFTELPASPVSMASLGSTRTPVVISVNRNGDRAWLSVLPPSDDATAAIPDNPRELTSADLGMIDMLRASNAPSCDRLPRIGLDISSRLFAESQLATLVAYMDRPIDVVHDLEAAAMPWELLAFERNGKVLFPARLAGVRRRLTIRARRTPAQPQPRRLERGERLRVLLVIDAQRLPDARMQADSLRSVAELHRNRITLHSLEGRDAAWPNVAEALREQWDVLHYAGLASFDARESSVETRPMWESISAVDDDAVRIPPLVVLDACIAASVRGLDETLFEQRNAASLAHAILVGGARTFIGTFWKVVDKSAASFADVFYRHLLSGDSVGLAVLAARRVLADPEIGDWASYHLYGDSELRW